VKTIESVLEAREEAKAMDIAHELKIPVEKVYQRLVHLEALGIVRLVPTFKTSGHRFHWGWNE